MNEQSKMTRAVSRGGRSLAGLFFVLIGVVAAAATAQTQKTAAASDRAWSVTFATLPASRTPAVMTIKGREKTLTPDNILIGDVWLLGGQSNMEFPLARVDNGALEIVSARFKNLRILTIPAQNGPDVKRGFPRLYEWSGWFGRHFRKGDWDV